MALGEIDVHGGLTFGNSGDVANKIVWWLGFDCSHAGDISPLPGTNRFFAIDGYCYRNFDYVKSEVEALAQQLHN